MKINKLFVQKYHQYFNMFQLNHFVMLKELKHCKEISELQCNSSVKSKAKEFIKKYMMKFGPVYQRPPEEMD